MNPRLVRHALALLPALLLVACLPSPRPPGTPRGDITSCHSWIRRLRNAAMDADR